LQGLIIFIVATPLWWTLATPGIAYPWVLAVGVVVTLFGLVYETIADWQLDLFIARKRAGTETAALIDQWPISIQPPTKLLGRGVGVVGICAECLR